MNDLAIGVVADDFAMPARGTNGQRGSKYWDAKTEELVNKLVKPGQGVIVPFIDGIPNAKHAKMLGVVLKNYKAEVGEYTTALIEGKGVAVRLNKLIAPKAEKPAEAPAKGAKAA